MQPKEIALQFELEGNITSVKPYGNGHINNTYLISTDEKDYILQGINQKVFKQPQNIIDNIKLLWETAPDSNIILKLVPTKKGRYAYAYPTENALWRIFPFAADYEAFEYVSEPWQAEKAGEAFASFIKTYKDIDINRLQDSIPNFHNGLMRFEQLEEAHSKASEERLEKASKLYQFACEHKCIFEKVQELIDKGDLPLRVTHNDTKLNNVLIGKTNRDNYCVIDLDTVMQGTLLFDFGDLVRTSASPTNENEPDETKIHINKEYFEAICKGYSKMKDIMTPLEKEMIVDGAKYMILIIGVRFLTDYYNNDIYFKTSYKEENFIRARNQFILLKKVEEDEAELREIAKKHFQ